MKRIVMTLLCSVGVWFGACDSSSLGGTETGNPPTSETRTLIGSVAPTTTPSTSVKSLASTLCAADLLVAVDSAAQTTQAEVDDDCRFEMTLTVRKAYAMTFSLSGSFVATFVYNPGYTSVTSSMWVVGRGSDDLNLGLATFTDDEAISEVNFASINDQDEDGFFDFDDEDDNGDGTRDEEEPDCDLDGFWDSHDDDDAACEEEDEEGGDEEEDTEGADGTGIVLAVVPRNNQLEVDLEKEIRVRTDCAINLESVTVDTFQVSGPDQAVVCTWELSDDGKTVDCEPQDALLPSTVYTALVSGVQCDNGSVVPDTTWSWTTDAAEEESE